MGKLSKLFFLKFEYFSERYLAIHSTLLWILVVNQVTKVDLFASAIEPLLKNCKTLVQCSQILTPLTVSEPRTQLTPSAVIGIRTFAHHTTLSTLIVVVTGYKTLVHAKTIQYFLIMNRF